MKSIVATTKAVVVIVSYVLVSGVVSQLTSYQPRYRPDCEHNCKELITLHVYCPLYGSCQWYCQETQANCTAGTRYHCARDLHNKGRFINACAAEIFCLAGEEPHISIQGTGNGKASAYCRPCYQRTMFNSYHNTSSATFSECPMRKKNLCTKQENKIDCGSIPYTELTKTDGYCRCDVRKGYAARSKDICFYDNEVCFKMKCPDGTELFLNYTCGVLCRDGYARPQESDICKQMAIPASEPTLTKHNPQHDFTDISTSSTRTFDQPSTHERLHKGLIISLSVSVTVFVVVILAILTRRSLKNKGIHRRNYMRNQTAGDEMQQFVTPENPDHGSASIKKKSEDSQTSFETSELVTDDLPTQPDYYKKDTCEEVFNFIFARNRSERERCLSTIDDKIVYDFNYLKCSTKITKPRLSHFQIISTVQIHGYNAFKAIGGVKQMCLFEWVSHLLSGNRSMMYILRAAAARHALLNFENYVNELTTTFLHSEIPNEDAQLFFKMHGIDCALATKECVSLAFCDLVGQTVTVGKENGPFLAEFLAGAVNCKIDHYFEDERYLDRDVKTIPTLRVTLTSSAPEDRKLQFYWMKPKGNVTPIYSLVPLFKIDAAIPAENRADPHQTFAAKSDSTGQDGIKVSDAQKEPNDSRHARSSGTEAIKGSDGQKHMTDSSTAKSGSASLGEDATVENPKTSTSQAEESEEAKEKTRHDELMSSLVEKGAADSSHAQSSGKQVRKILDVQKQTKDSSNKKTEKDELIYSRLQEETTNSSHAKPSDKDAVKGFDGQEQTMDSSQAKSSDSDQTLGSNKIASSSPPAHESSHDIGLDLRESIYKCMCSLKITDAEQRNKCLRYINTKSSTNLDDLKELVEKLEPNPSLFTRINISAMPQFTAYRPAGHETLCMYQTFSLFIVYHPYYHNVLRIAAARFALNRFDDYVKQLTEAFEKSGNRDGNATLFFEMHGIKLKVPWWPWQSTKICDAFVDMVKEFVSEGKGLGPFYLKILGDALDINIINFFEDNQYNGQDGTKIQGLNVTLNSGASRELHVYWMKSSGESRYKYNMVPLFKNTSTSKETTL